MQTFDFRGMLSISNLRHASSLFFEKMLKVLIALMQGNAEIYTLFGKLTVSFWTPVVGVYGKGSYC